MKVVIGPYKNWFGPYQLAEALCFWVKKQPDKYGTYNKPEWVHTFGEWLAGYKDDSEGNNIGKDSRLYKFLLWLDKFKKRKVKIRIDKYDTWSMDATLAMIVLPMLKQLKATKHGSAFVDLEDVPPHLRATTTENYDAQLTFEFYQEHEIKEGECDIHARWDWVLGEMIWAFEQLQPDVDWQSQYSTGEIDWKTKKSEKLYNGEVVYEMVDGPKHTYKVDYEAVQRHEDRIRNGLRLFGVYFQALWD